EETTDVGHAIKRMSRDSIWPDAAESGAAAECDESRAKSRFPRPRRSASKATPRPASAVSCLCAAVISAVCLARNRIQWEDFDTIAAPPARPASDPETRVD